VKLGELNFINPK